MTFHHGLLPFPVEEPPADYLEALLGAIDLDAYLLEIHSNWAEAVREWLAAPLKMRVIGPGVQELSGLSIAESFDFLIHCRRVTPAHSL